ncbi:MAG: outer membrane lipoprotein-sorting protein [Deltaproteobacteria bacterium]|nr:outer membrane lipoprotein-sorting protein [Deltaproteobacteria bacterium]MBW1870543.1 outer membrane lipoprotein-sorting protein [Deltaproteobacteria bacterium]
MKNDCLTSCSVSRTYPTFRLATIAGLLLWAWLPALAADVDKDILLQVDRRLQHESYEAYRKLINIEPDGSRKEFVLYTLKKGREKVAALFLSPASEKGRATLRLGENMWLYIPNVGKPLRITSLQSVTGGVFNNSDILRLDYAAEYNVEAAEKKTDHIFLKLKAKSAGIAYDRLEMEVDPKTLTPRSIRCLAASGMLIKTLTFKKMKDFGGGLVRPSVIETVSPLQKGYRSVMVFAKINAKKIQDEVFTLNYLSKLEELR